MTDPSVIGQIITRKDVTDAVISLLTDTPGTTPNWLELYLSEIESQKNILTRLPRPAAPGSVHGGLDFESWDQELIPEIIVVAQPFGDAEFRGNGDYDQWFEIEIAAMIVGESEVGTVEIADYYGAAIMAAITQNQDLGPLNAVRTRLMSSPRTEFDRVDTRVWVRSICLFHTLVQAVVNQYSRPVSSTPIPPDGPFVADTVDITLDVYPTGAPIPPTD